MQVVQYLREQGIDIFMVDREKNNAVHSLASSAAIYPEKEPELNEALLFLKGSLTTGGTIA